MNRRMLFKFGVTLVIGVGIILFYLVNVQDVDRKTTTKLVNNIDFHQLNPAPPSGKVADAVVARDNSLQFPAENLPHLSSNDKYDTPNLKGRTGSDAGPQANNGSQKTSTYFDNPAKDHIREEYNFPDKGLEPVYRSHFQPTSYAVHLCVVVCGDRREETLTMLKSALMVTPSSVPLVFHIVTEPQHQLYFLNQFGVMPKVYRDRLYYNVYNVTFPGGATSDSWRKLFKPCASQRLFLPDLLKSVDSLIYVDTDTLFLRSLADLWSYFSYFNQSQLAGLVSEAEDGTAGWYNRFANHPYYGDFGVNSGVMLMNLTRLRQTSWLNDMQEFYNQYRLTIPWGDQDLINIFFAAHPDQLYLLSCPWNYRSDHCKYMSNCRLAEEEGVSVLHGSRRMFYDDREPAFAAVFNTFRNYHLGDDLEYYFLAVLDEAMKTATPSNCGKVSHIFFKQLQKLLDRNQELYLQMEKGLNVSGDTSKQKGRMTNQQDQRDMQAKAGASQNQQFDKSHAVNLNKNPGLNTQLSSSHRQVNFNQNPYHLSDQVSSNNGNINPQRKQVNADDKVSSDNDQVSVQ